MKKILIVLSFLSLSACDQKIYLETQKNGISIAAQVDNKFSPLSEKDYELKGNLLIRNTTNDRLSFSNQELYLVSPTIETRTYKESLASNTIDFAHIVVPANTTIEQKVYWVVESISIPSTKDLRIELRN